jgi:geranylgeranyl pyrophosphate synthase/predicted secreted hydrolase
MDWPAEEVNLSTHDLPHASSLLEWWYFHAHLRSEDGRQISVFTSFFRAIIDSDPVTKAPIYGHLLAWAVSDPSKRKYYSDSRMEDSVRAQGLVRLRKGEGTPDPRIRRALSEILARGNLPKPDKHFTGPVHVPTGCMDFDYSGSKLKKEEDGSYTVHLEGDGVGCTLNFTPKKAACLHGDGGLVYGVDGEDMFYYFIPRNEVSGEVFIDGRTVEVQGEGWYDHEFGGQRDPAKRYRPATRDTAWNWIALQLDDGREFTAYVMDELSKKRRLDSAAVLVARDGSTRRSHDVTDEVTKWWQSVRSFERYPSKSIIRAPALGVDISIEAVFEDQEFLTLMSKPSFWEGQVKVTGTIDHEPVDGLAYVEYTGHSPMDTLPEFFNAVGRVVRDSVKESLPEHPSKAEAANLFASRQHAYLLDGLDTDRLSNYVFEPVREISRRGGKAWRSYAALACCDVVGGDSRRAAKWLGLLEILHTGSLIIDDVEDRSVIRRGGPTAHVMFSEPQAINSGCAAYFMGQGLGSEEEREEEKKQVTDEEKLHIYDLYFEGLRAAHAGQALDIMGFDDMVDEAVRTGNTSALEHHIKGIARLKTGAPCGGLARMGVVAGKGTKAQEEGLGVFFENLGVAFQIVDDVLNLKGFEGRLKDVGEDIAAGKVTYPVAKALGRMAPDIRTKFIMKLRSCPKNPAVIRSMIDTLDSTRAFDDCLAEAQSLIDESWSRVEPLLEDSISKMMLRAFGWYVVERYY